MKKIRVTTQVVELVSVKVLAKAEKILQSKYNNKARFLAIAIGEVIKQEVSSITLDHGSCEVTYLLTKNVSSSTIKAYDALKIKYTITGV